MTEDQIAAKILLVCDMIEDAASQFPQVKGAGVYAIGLNQNAPAFKIKKVLAPLRDEVRKIQALRRMEGGE